MDRTINTAILWDAKDVQRNILDGIFSFNGWNLDNGQNIRVIQSNHDDLWTVQFDTYDTPLQDGWWVLWKYYRKKTIQLVLSVNGNTQEWLNVLIDEIKYQTSKTEWTLRIVINWVVRERTATCTSLKFNRKNYNVSRAGNVVLTFTCVNPLSFNLTSITNTYTGISGNYATELNYSWKVNCYPSIYLIIKSETWLNSFSIDMNWYLFTISNEFEAGDFIIIDGETKLAKLNWTVITYSWPFPIIEPWLNHIEIKVNSGALVNYDMIFIYKKLFL